MLLIAEKEATTHERTIRFQFLATPIEIKGNGKVEEVVFQRTGSSETFTVACDLVITAIGYEPLPIPQVPMEKGRVVNSDGVVADNLYVVGWAKRGPSGVIGTNKSDAADVMKTLVGSLTVPKNAGDISELLGPHKVITQSQWEIINSVEISRGEPLGKPRKKAADREELIRLGGV
jgi:ferredoxin--NADP+ reductase